MRRIWLLMSILVLLLFRTGAQSLPFTRYTSQNGLAADRITAMTQDDEGYIWLGSYFGICRYNGLRFEKTDLPVIARNKYVTCLLTANHKVYAGFKFGGGLMEYSDGVGHCYTIPGLNRDANEVNCMTEGDHGSVLFCNTLNQVYRFKDGSISLVHKSEALSGAGIKYMVQDQQQVIWLGTEKGMFVLPPPYDQALPFFAGDNIIALSTDISRNLYCCHFDGHSYVVDVFDGLNANLLSNKNTIAKLNDVRETTVNNYPQTDFWLLDHHNQVIRLRKNTQPIFYQGMLDANTDIKAILIDREENIWISNDPGIVKLSNPEIRTYFFDQLAASNGAVVKQNDHLFWATNSKSLYQLSGNKFQKVVFPIDKSDLVGTLFVDRQQQLWYNTWNGGIWCTSWRGTQCTGQKYYASFSGIPIKVQAIIDDDEGNIFIGGINGLFRIRNGAVKECFQPKNTEGGRSFITAVAIDKKQHLLWLGDNACGITKVKYEIRAGSYIYTMLDHINEKTGLTDPYIRSLFLDDQQQLWAGTRFGGIFRIREQNGKYQIQNCNQEAQLECTRISHITTAGPSAIWFSSCNGIYEYNSHSKLWKHFSTSEGLLNNEVFSSFFDQQANKGYAVTAQGLTILNTNASSATRPPLVHITNMTAAGKNADRAFLASGNAHRFRENAIGFEFVGLSFIDEHKINYRYKLDGYDSAWSRTSNSNSVMYASLPPGHYTFRVMAQNARGQWSNHTASVPFIITVPFYKTPLFYLTLVLVFCLSFYWIRIQQLRQRYKLEQLRLGIARDLHDDIGSTLGSINLISKSSIRKLQGAASAADVISAFDKIGHSASTILDSMDDIVWTINPSKDKVEDLVIRMREFAIPLLEAGFIRFEFKLKGNEALSIGMNVRKSIFLVFKESIHNIIKHADASDVYINIAVDTHQISLQVSDNGKGFAQTNTSRNGLKNMHYRTEAVHGTLTVKSTANGTTIDFTAPLR